jgi:hypothetical protein
VSIIVVLRPGQSGNDVYLRPDRTPLIDVYLYSGQTGNDVYLRQERRPYDTGEVAPPPSFPTQFAGLRVYYGGAVRELCLVAEADAPTGMGGVLKVNKNGTLYAVYLVELADTNATPVRVQTSTGTKAIRLKT